VIFLGHLLAKLLTKKTLLAITDKKQVQFAHATSVQSSGFNWLTYGGFDCPDLLAML